jgi:hypothetical protein
MIRLLALVLVLGVGAEVAAPRVVESRMEARIEEQTDGAITANAELDSFPFLTRLLLTEQVSELTITLEDVAGQAIHFSRVAMTVEGVTIDRSALLSGEVEIRDIDHGRITAVISEQALGDALGHAVSLQPGRAAVEAAGTTVEVDLTVRRGEIAIGGEGIALEIALPAEYVPCDPDAEIEDGRVVLTCDIEEIPEEFVRILARST